MLRARWVLALAVGLGACGGGDERGPDAAAGAPVPEVQWPPGTVLAVDGVPLSIDEVDEASVWVEPIDRKVVGKQLRRLALTNVALPRLVARMIAGEEEVARARAEAEESLAALRAGTHPGPDESGAYGEVATGNFQIHGIAVWGRALSLPRGEWSDVFEDVGRFLVVRWTSREDAPVPEATVLEIDVLAFEYLPHESAAGMVERDYDDRELTIVDPLWREIVPELLQYRMGVHEP